MQEQSFEPGPAHALVERAFAVFFIASHRVADVCAMDANLMGASGLDGHLAQTRIGIALKLAQVRDRRFALGVHAHHALAALQDRFAQGLTHRHARLGQSALQQGQVMLACPPFADLFLQCRQGRALAGKHEYATGVPVQSMHQFEAVLRSRCAQQFDCAKTDATAAVAGNSAGFVEHEEFAVLMQDGLLDPAQLSAGGRSWIIPLRSSHRRNSHLVPCLQAGIWLRPAPIDAHLASTKNTVDQAARHPLEATGKEIVDPLPGSIRLDLDYLHAVRDRICKVGRSVCLH